MNVPLRYGLVGCGGFGRYCLQEYAGLPSVRAVAVADVNDWLARKTADEHGLTACATPEELIARADVDLVHFATPPSTHAPLALAALRAGKHVLCEKPLALTLDDAREMVATARERQRVLAVNLIMRYNPLCRAVKELVDRRILGEPLYASLVNVAQDELLPPQHWFWDRRQSGGIFIEHGVHFFDLFEWWFGPGEVLSAEEIRRPGMDLIDQVRCSVRYGTSTLGTFYHGFHQMLRRDQQHWQLVFETGVVTLSEWVPTRVRMDVTVEEAALESLAGLFPGAEVQVVERYTGERRAAVSRHRQRTVDVKAVLRATAGRGKMELYGDMLRMLLGDQIAAMDNPSHPRLVSEGNGVSSLAYAAEAQALATRTVQG